MRISSIFITFFLILSLSVFGQTKTLTGKVIGQGFQPISDFKINILDSFHLPDINVATGEFEIEIPDSLSQLKLCAVGYDWKYILLDRTCSHLEVILQNHILGEDPIELYEQERLNGFRKLFKLHNEAFNRGIFKDKKPCYKQRFIPNSKLKRFQHIII